MKVKTIIFSKDRACQLDMLLRSVNKYYPQCDYQILYTYSDTKYKEGYEKIKDSRFVFENDFKSDLLNLIESEYTCFLVDDDIFINPFSESDIEFRLFSKEYSNQILCLSLRMSPEINYSYTRNRRLQPEETIWNWRGKKSYWGYPMSLDGHIFRTSEILPLLQNLEYKNPNTLEYQLSINPIDLPLMYSYIKSRVVNIPMNLVQNVYNNRHLGICQSELNTKFLNGRRLYIEVPEIVNSCHMELKHEMK